MRKPLRVFLTSVLALQLNSNVMGKILSWQNTPAPLKSAELPSPATSLAQVFLPVAPSSRALPCRSWGCSSQRTPLNRARIWRGAVRKICGSPFLFVSGEPFRFIVLGSKSPVLSCISHLRKPSQACQVLQGFLSKLGQAEKFYVLLTVNLKATQTFILLAAQVWVFHDVWPTWLEFSVWGFIMKS